MMDNETSAKPAPAAGAVSVPLARQDQPFVGKRVEALEGIRGFGIFLVIFHHYVMFDTTGYTSYIVNHISDMLWIGVNVAFVISGFLITGILYDTKQVKGYFHKFYARRAIRILPLYYAYLIVHYIFYYKLRIASSGGGELPITGSLYAWLSTFGTNIYIAIKGKFILASVHHFWSLAIEEHFYLIWPLVVYFCNLKTLGRVCWAMIVGALVFRTVTMIYYPSFSYSTHFLIPFRMDDMALGGLIAVIARSPDARAKLAHYGPRLALGGCIAMCALWAYNHGYNYADPIIAALGYTPVGFACAGLIATVIASPESRLSRTLNARWLLFLGKYIFGIYIFNHPINIVLTRYWVSDSARERFGDLVGSGVTGMLTRMAVGIPISLVIAVLAWKCIEEPALRLKKYFRYRDGAKE